MLLDPLSRGNTNPFTQLSQHLRQCQQIRSRQIRQLWVPSTQSRENTNHFTRLSQHSHQCQQAHLPQTRHRVPRIKLEELITRHYLRCYMSYNRYFDLAALFSIKLSYFYDHRGTGIQSFLRRSRNKNDSLLKIRRHVHTKTVCQFDNRRNIQPRQGLAVWNRVTINANVTKDLIAVAH